MPDKELKKRSDRIIRLLEENFPDARCSLDFKSPLQLLAATILSAQCTDERVNIVTRDLFRKYRTAVDYAGADLAELEQDVRSTGFYKNKARSLKESCRVIVEEHGGKVPADMDALVKMPGIGRKTANVVLGNAFGVPGITVDTHVGRVSQRLGLTKNKDAVKIEFDLMDLWPREKWTVLCHQVIQHGRAVCKARKPLCDKCDLLELCDYGRQNNRP